MRLPADPPHNILPITGTSAFGQPSCVRTPRARKPPRSRKMIPVNRNWMPMILWSCEKMYFCRKPMSSCPCAWSAAGVLGSVMVKTPLCQAANGLFRLGGRLPLRRLGGPQPVQVVFRRVVDEHLAAHQRVAVAAVLGTRQLPHVRRVLLPLLLRRVEP